MSPTVFRVKNYRFYFLSNEEDRITFMPNAKTARRNFGWNRSSPWLIVSD